MNLKDRMYLQNKYTNSQIYCKTGVKIENSVLCVGNNVERRELLAYIKDYKSVCLIGESCSGRYTSTVELANILNVDIYTSYNGEDFGNEPFDNPDDIYVIRYNKMSKWIKSYSDGNCRVIIIAEEKVPNYLIISYTKASSRDIQLYESKKGRFPIYTPIIQLDEKKLVMKALREGVSEDEMPDRLANWFAYNFRNANILALCSYADQLKDNFFKHAILSTIRYKKPISLKIPYGVKR